MKYKLIYHSGWISLTPSVTSDTNPKGLSIYDPHGDVLPDWPGGFWYEPTVNQFNPKAGGGYLYDLAEDYIENREEYIAEAKKLLLKEML